MKTVESFRMSANLLTGSINYALAFIMVAVHYVSPLRPSENSWIHTDKGGLIKRPLRAVACSGFYQWEEH